MPRIQEFETFITDSKNREYSNAKENKKKLKVDV